MSWYGEHPNALTKQQVRALSPKGICKNCVYWIRVTGDRNRPLYGLNPDQLRRRPLKPCPRCGIPRNVIYQIIWELRGCPA